MKPAHSLGKGVTMMYRNCQKEKAFKLFDQGKRPAEVFDKLALKKTTIFRYYQLWKKKQALAERNRLLLHLRARIKSCQFQIEYMQRHPGSPTVFGDLAQWQRSKLRAEQGLKYPSSVTDEYRELLAKLYSGR